MLKILIADDEPLIINGLQKLVNWEELGCEVIGEALNGKEALELLEKKEPDIAIFDICMPEATGLDLIKKINRDKMKTKVIFISGYQDFFYAQEALNQGAVEYLLKPVKKVNLEQAVKKTQRIIWQQNPITLLEEKTEIQEIFGDINKNDEYAREDLYDRFTSLGLDVKDKQLAGLCFAISDKDKKALENNMYERYELLRFSLYNKIEDYFKDTKQGFVIKRDDSSCNIMIILEEGDKALIKEKFVQPVLDLIQRDYSLDLFVGIGDTAESVKNMKYAYKTANFAFEMKFFEEKPVILYEQIKKEYSKSFEDYQQAYDRITKKILAGDRNLEEDLLVLLDIIESLHYGNRYAALNRCFSFSVNLFQLLEEYHLADASFREKQDDFMNAIRGMDQYKEVKEAFLGYYKALISRIYDEVGNKDKLVVGRIKEYIQQNYAQNVTLAHMAKLFYMNPYYFSAFFKKQTGKNFKDYLTDIRMKEAIRLILTTDMRTYEIAEKVGYNNVRQFADKFKELYKTTPAEYKKVKLK